MLFLRNKPQNTFHFTLGCLIVCFFIVCASHIIFSRGLALDGVHILYRMIMKDSFYFLETARITFHFLQQLPAWLFIKFAPSNSLSLLTLVFSFGLIWIHFLAFAGCYLILPKDKKYMLFFPLFAFFVGPVTGFGASISASLSVFSWIWLTAFVIHYSNLSLKWHKIIFFITPLPLFLSHEMMSYMAWPLIALSILKIKKQTLFISRLFLTHIGLFAFMYVLSVYFIVFPEQSELDNRAEFIQSLFRLEFFLKIKDGHIEWIYPPTLSAFFLLVLPLGQLFKEKLKLIFSFTGLLCIILCGTISVILPFYDLGIFKLIEEEEARVWVACIALPGTLLLWWLFEHNKLKLEGLFFLACALATVSLTAWRLGSDSIFYQYQKQFTERISACRGIIDWSALFKNSKAQNKFDSKIFNLLNRKWKYMSSSLIYPRHSKIKKIVKSTNRFTGCYQQPPYGMCENDIPTKNNKFFDFEKLLYYEKNKMTGCSYTDSI